MISAVSSEELEAEREPFELRQMKHIEQKEQVVNIFTATQQGNIEIVRHFLGIIVTNE